MASSPPTDLAIVCPVLATLTREGQLQPDASGQVGVGELSRALRSLGLSRTTIAVLDAAAIFRGNRGASKVARNVARLGTNLRELRDGPLDHAADTGILASGPFDAARFDALVSHSADGATMTVTDLGAALRENDARDPSPQGKRVSSVELAAALLVFGQQAAGGAWSIRIDSLRDLFEHHRLPAGWTPHSVRLREVLDVSKAILAAADTAG